MELPIELKIAIEKRLENANIKQLQKDAENISLRYRTESGKGKRLLTEELEALSYSAVRMPATFGAVCTAIKNMLEIYTSVIDGTGIETLLDVGAGTGAGTWAASRFLDFEKVTCLEREDVMLNLGKSLMQESDDEEMKKVVWKKFDLLTDNIEEKADLVICSYVLNELSDEDRIKALDKLWKATNKFLLIIEPGTPVGFNQLKEIRAKLIENGASVIAPCTHSCKCCMPENDWCHTTCRVSRSKIHKLLKNGDVPYEDEKFSYIAVSKSSFKINDMSRVLRHPIIEPGKITLEVCSEEGIKQIVVTKKDKNLFKKARKLKCGDMLKN